MANKTLLEDTIKAHRKLFGSAPEVEESEGHPIVPCQAKNTFQEISFRIKEL